MPLEYEAIRKSFNRVANQYEENAVLQKEVLSRLLERLDDEQKIDINLKPQQILDLGCGTGWAIEGINALFPAAQITALDFSSEMLKQVNSASAKIIHADVHDLPIDDNTFDIVFASMLLHWTNEQDVFNEARRVLKPGGLLVMSCLGETSLFELKQVFAQLDSQKHVHDFPALHDLGDNLLNKGFEQVVVNAEVITLTYKSIIAFMKDIKASGGHNVEEIRHKGLMTKGQFDKIQKAYEEFREEGRLPASYEIVYLRAIKPKNTGDINLSIQG